jgi:hypothetical protein
VRSVKKLTIIDANCVMSQQIKSQSHCIHKSTFFDKVKRPTDFGMSVDLQTKFHLDLECLIKFYTDHQHYNWICVVTALPEVRYEDYFETAH